MQHFPEPCNECRPYGGTHRLAVKENGVEGLERCDCARGKLLARADDRRLNPPDIDDFSPTLSSKAAQQAACSLLSIPDAPRSDEAVTMIADELMHLCRNVEQVRWLVRRAIRLFSSWPGVRELRILHCSKFLAADGDDMSGAESIFYPSGIPPERARVEEIRRALPAGAVTADVALDGEVRTAATLKRIAAPRRNHA